MQLGYLGLFCIVNIFNLPKIIEKYMPQGPTLKFTNKHVDPRRSL